LIQISSSKIKYLAIAMIWVYQTLLSPLWPASCRFYPTCSAYAREAIEKYGLVKGCWLAFRRIIKCHPFHPGGYDPLP
jgi:hypothetical protein